MPIDPGKKSFYFLNASDFRMTGAEFTLDGANRAGEQGGAVPGNFIRIDHGEPYSDRDIPNSAPHSTTSLLLIRTCRALAGQP